MSGELVDCREFISTLNGLSQGWREASYASEGAASANSRNRIKVDVLCPCKVIHIQKILIQVRRANGKIIDSCNKPGWMIAMV